MLIKNFNSEQIKKHNQDAWNINVENGCRWSVPTSKEKIETARAGEFEIFLTPKAPIPKDWLGEVKNRSILLLAGGGGQQSSLLAAAGAKVTVVDLSNKQLEQDTIISNAEDLNILTVCSSANNLSMFDDQSFDLIINPLSNCFFEDLKPVWKEASRVIKKQGTLLFAFGNPIAYLFDFEKANQGNFELKYSQPFSDLDSFNDEEKRKFLAKENPLEFGHSLDEQIGELCKQDFAITGLFEDYWDTEDPLNKHFPQFINIKAVKI